MIRLDNRYPGPLPYPTLKLTAILRKDHHSELFEPHLSSDIENRCFHIVFWST